MLDLFSMTVDNAFDFETYTFFGLHTMLSIIGHDMFVIACATFNTGIWTVLDYLIPRVEVIA
jgi:hypothetical protein